MGHYRQQLIRGRALDGAPGGEPSGVQPPIMTSVVLSGGWTFTLTAALLSNPNFYMQLYNGSGGSVGERMAGFGKVLASPASAFVDNDFGSSYWSRLTQNADGSGIAGPVSALYNPPF